MWPIVTVALGVRVSHFFCAPLVIQLWDPPCGGLEVVLQKRLLHLCTDQSDTQKLGGDPPPLPQPWAMF